MKNESYITKSIDLHLFFMRIMKEHMLFINAAFTPQNFGMQEKATLLMNQASKFLSKIVTLANGNVSAGTLNSGEVVTKYTFDAESATAYYTKIPIDTQITAAEHELTPRMNQNITMSDNDMLALNNEAYTIVSNIISYKTELLDQVLKCAIFTLNYPLLIDHILREAKHYLEALVKLQNPTQTISQNELIKEEIFWNNIMAEHSKFIRGLLDPMEEGLYKASDMFAHKFDELTREAKKAEQNVYQLSGITNQSLIETEKIKSFNEQGAEGLLTCKVKSIILPLLADHVLRESNHYLNILKSYR